MRKQLLSLGVLAGAVACYVAVDASPVPPYRTMEVPYAEINVDGTADAGYGPEQTTDWMYPAQQEGYGGASDFTAVFNVAYDLDYLYIIATLTDDIAENYEWGYSSEWMFDNIEWFVQLDTNTAATAYDDGTEQLRIDRGLDSVQTAGQVPRSTYMYHMEDPTGTGWLTEVGMPWGAVYTGGVLPEDILTYMEDAMGFDFSGADADDSDGDPVVGSRDYQTAWDLDGQDGTEDLAWNNVTTFGYITFGEVPNALPSTTSNSVNAFPNPATSLITFEIEGVREIEILGVTGNLIKVVESSGLVDISDLKSGIYFARIDDTLTKFFVK